VADRIGVPLELEGFEVTGSEVVNDTLEVEVRSTRRPACHHCGSLDVVIHATHERRIRDRACGYPTLLRWAQRRFRCKDCARTCRERHPEISPRRSITIRFRRHLYERALAHPFADVAAAESVSAYRVLEAFDWHSLHELKAPLVGTPPVIAIDESSFRKPWIYNTVLSDPQGGPFEMFEGRDQGSVETALEALSPQVRAGIKAVVMDLFWPYRKAVERVLPDARIVADRFHVYIAMGRAANRVRRRHGIRPIPRSPRTGRPLPRSKFRRFDPEVLVTKWIFMKRAHKLTGDERARLERLFGRFPEMGAAWRLRESFAAIYEAPNRAEGERRLTSWEADLAASGLYELQTTWRYLSEWREAILAFFDWPVTNAYAEGVNNRIKVIKRCSYGFTNAQRYRRKVLLACGHRSCS
jgi:transposase